MTLTSTRKVTVIKSYIHIQADVKNTTREMCMLLENQITGADKGFSSNLGSGLAFGIARGSHGGCHLEMMRSAPFLSICQSQKEICLLN